MSEDAAIAGGGPARSGVPRRRRWLRWIVWPAVAVLVLLTAGYVLLGSQAALDYVLARAVAAADGRLTIEGGEGSLLSTVRVTRIAWRGDDVDVEARDIALAWSPLDLVSRRFIVQGLGAKRLAFEFRQSASSTNGLPANLALPLEVDVGNIGVERIDWRTGEGSGYVTGVSFGYSGGARQHAVRALRFATDNGTLTGSAEVDATAPFALRGALAFEGAGSYGGGRANLAGEGTLARIGIAGEGSLRNANIAVKATLTPFEAALLVSADVDARDVDLAQFVAALPTTALTLRLAARPEGSGFAGTLTATNATVGTLDTGRIPVAALSSRFAWDGHVLALSGVDAQLAGNGRATGDITVPVDGGPVRTQLTLTNVDLARMQSSLLSTRLGGTIAAEVAQDRQVIRGDIRQADLALAFAATVVGRQVTVERLRAQAGDGEVTGSGSLTLDGTRPFALSARATRFDPSRFAAMPAAQLDGTIEARGTLAPTWDVTADIALAPGSRFAGTDVSGTARAHVTPTTARDVNAKARIGSASIALTGSFGTAADTLAFDLDVPRVAELRPLLVRYANVALPEAMSGALRARGSVTGDPHQPGFTLDAHAEALQWGPTLRAATIDVNATAAAGTGPAGQIALEARPVKLTLTATHIVAPPGQFASVRATVGGTLAEHKGTLAATGEGFDVAAGLDGGVVELKRTNGAVESGWRGTLRTLVNRGAYPLELEAPASLEIARDHVYIGAAHIAVAEGRANLESLVVDAGRLETRGSFTGIPVTALARLAGNALPFPSTLVLGGEWSLAAAPRLNGTLNIRRERGDWYATESANLDPADLALGISVLDLSAQFSDDALAASAHFRSLRAGTADASATLGAGRVAGRVATDAPMTATLTAELASLRPLQPWVGTLAVMDGRMNVDIQARGTLAQPEVSGTMSGDALRFDLAQFGVHLHDGRLRARLAERTLVLDEFSLVGGSGRFTAKGTLARAAGATAVGDAPAARVDWQAEDFTVVNRPDMRLVADGKGTLALQGGKLALTGNISIDEGRIDYAPTQVGRLSDDVVIVGAPRRTAADASTRALPLALDLEVDLGNKFQFSADGLDTRLAGSVHVSTTAAGTLAAKGTIRAVSGTFFVFGQRLDIDRGRLIFDGPADNPALDVVALRRNLAVEAGVEVTGTVRVPRVRLVSNPPVPDGEKLSWLISGQGLDRANRGDLAALSAASASLLGQGQKPITTQIANQIGLDDISVRGASSSAVAGTTGQVVAFGKRISDRLSLVYQQGLTVANNALRIEYALSRTLTLRAEAGVVSSFGLYFRRSYD